jgi:hypothetical protein
MIYSSEVLMYLRPDGGMLQTGTEYEGIEFISCEPFTKEEYENAFTLLKAKKAKAEADKAKAKTSAQAKLSALGLTEEEVASILG